ncbi:efflux RND transporter periplasmic adaptor subunit [Yersinia hibernica]|uniref:Efflux RND transporter periplasmic adaptor subunit n=1 Tax=Yersinia enterocolitica LC20 TaxID=1443113 RepID=A0A7U4GD09_YEREN|nr:efflux RND transporter periplasmic adaptor subunit [Yersinia hibernica]AHM72009.1 efflux RND transporter periplasmic adaptor subunit [Yersinia hibernica]OVZ94321.1 efflux transporter periplasmic adaptor subunit [Yersinia kristensenii]
MKKLFSLTLVAVAVISGLGGYLLGKPASHFTDTASPDTTTDSRRKVLYWYDPMSPAQRFDKPGKSPFMDMELVPRYAGETVEDAGVTISARQQQNLGVRTAPAELRVLDYRLTGYGTVATDERSVQVIAARANGIIEQLYVRANQQSVTKNQPLAQLWVPDWSAAQQEYLAIRKLGDSALTTAARQRLQLQFMPEEVIRSVEKSGQPQTRVTLRSPATGYVNKLDIRAGSQVSATQSLFELASLDPVWIVVDYPQSQASLVTIGSEIAATTASWPGETFHGKVSELLPSMDLTTRTLKARITVENPQQKLKPGMYLNVQSTQIAPREPVLVIAQEALLMSGNRNTVLLAEGDGHFKPVEVSIGQTQDGWVEIKSGLSNGQLVVTSGQFLIDSEASLHSALPQMNDIPATASSAAVSAPADIYSVQGEVNAINGATITLSHGPIAALKWGAMTMDFLLPPGKLSADIDVGSKVNFTFTLNEQGAQIRQILPVKTNNTTDIHGSHL